MSSTLAKIRKQRLEKVNKLRKLGIDPYPARSNRSHTNKELIENFNKLEKNEVTVVGRVMAWREHGSLRFANIQDFTGIIQLIIKKDQILKYSKKEQRLGWKELNLIDIGDFVQAKGKLMKSKTGEISVNIIEIKILVKTIRPLPEKWEGIQDTEIKLRRRYLDMTMNRSIKELFLKKSEFWKSMREFMQKSGFTEIRTPILEPATGGADANPFVTYHDALNTDFYLRISLELPLKRAIGGGFEKVFEIGPVFRNEGIDDEHLQDYDMMEFYWAYADYSKSMKLVENLYKNMAQKCFHTLKFKIKGHNVNLDNKWEKIDYVETIHDRFRINVISADEEELRLKMKELKLDYDKASKKPRLVDTLWKEIRKDIKGPVFLINQPKFISPLAKTKVDDSNKTERYQIIIAGSELGNGYSELNDPIDQYERFTEQQKMRDLGDDEAQMLDIDFVEMLEYGMPPTSGFGVSERLFSYLVDQPIRKTVMFPQMKRELEKTTLEIYKIKKSNIGKVRHQLISKDNDIKGAQKIVKNSNFTIQKAHKLLNQYVKSKSLLNHCQMVADAMKGMADRYEQDEEIWYIAGLLHDFDYEKWPDKHPMKGKSILVKSGVPEEIINAIQGHATFTDVPRNTKMAKVLFAVDELSGFMNAVSLMRPNRFADMKIRSVMKKFKDKHFAEKINRDVIKQGADELSIELDELIKNLIEIFRDK